MNQKRKPVFPAALVLRTLVRWIGVAGFGSQDDGRGRRSAARRPGRSKQLETRFLEEGR
ncbi:hypothetical protein KKF05_02220 [Patescibacteria group bacterium]|nr:hypothetical protein [Patescibacteria group bacterium]